MNLLSIGFTQSGNTFNISYSMPTNDKGNIGRMPIIGQSVIIIYKKFARINRSHLIGCMKTVACAETLAMFALTFCTSLDWFVMYLSLKFLTLQRKSQLAYVKKKHWFF